MLTLAPMAKRHYQFTPAELDRLPMADARWMVEHLPVNLRKVAELELAGDDAGAWGLCCALASIVGRIRRGASGMTDHEWYAQQSERLQVAMGGVR